MWPVEACNYLSAMSENTPYSAFIQQQPKLGNEFENDVFLISYLQAFVPLDVLASIKPDLIQFGHRVTGEIFVWGRDAELNQPQLTQFDAFGKRIDRIDVAQGWLKLGEAAAHEGLVAIGYERAQGEYSRLYQFTKLYLYTASSAIYTCPLAMTDGAARLIEVHGNGALRAEFEGLTSRQMPGFLTSGQWMTERTGGSDVSRSMTLAKPTTDGYELYGHKWFTSAITANMAFTLASTEWPEPGKRAPLSLFQLQIRNGDGSLNGIEVEALKDKLGTRALPTAQLVLKGAKARMVGEKGRGVATISTLFNITRIYNTVSAVSYMRRAFALCEAYGHIRWAFGKNVGEHVLYQKSLSSLGLTYRSNALLAFKLARLLGREECNVASDSEKSLLRLLTPVAKLYTAKQAIASASEAVEMFGGLGYLEDTGIPSILRDAQVLSIWEGTTNVLSLDMLRAIQKENGLAAFAEFSQNVLQNSTNQFAPTVLLKAQKLQNHLQYLDLPEMWEAQSRTVAFYLAELTVALLWLELIDKQPDNLQHHNDLKAWLVLRPDDRTLQLP